MENNKPDFEAMLKKNAFKIHPLDTEKAAVSIDHADWCLEHLWNTHVVPLQRELDNEIKIREEYFEDAQLLLEDKRRLQSENKDLQEKLKIADHLKELADDAIVSLQKENERLKNDLLDALDLKDGKGTTALSMAIYEIKHLREEVERLKDNEVKFYKCEYCGYEKDFKIDV